MYTRTLRILGWLAALSALLALACAAQATNMTVEGTPGAICPSSTPRPTHTQIPPDAPMYPAAFQANLNYTYVGPNRSVVILQYIAQNVGMVTYQHPTGAGTLASTGAWPGMVGSLPVFIPMSVSTATIRLTSAAGVITLTVTRYTVVVASSPIAPPCCLPGPLYPTPRPTRTPWPTPTLYQIQPPQGFPLNVPVRNNSGPVRLVFRLRQVQHKDFPLVPLFTAAMWEVEISNVGAVEFDFIGALQTYVSEVDWLGARKAGIWSPAHQAAQFMGIVEQAYNPTALLPGQTVTVRVAAWIPMTAQVTKVTFILNMYHAGDPGYATFIPGKERLLTWENRPDAGCPAW